MMTDEDYIWSNRGKNSKEGRLRAETLIIIDEKRKLETDFVLKFRFWFCGNQMFIGEFWTAEAKLSEISKRTHKHVLAYHLKAPNKAFDFPVDERYYVLQVFEDASMLKKIQNRTGKRKKFDNVYPYFLMNTLEHIKKHNFFWGWVNLRWESVDILPMLYALGQEDGEYSEDKYRDEDWWK